METLKYKEGDKVIADGVGLWLTITRVMPCGWYETRFGSIGGYCGKFKEYQLNSYGG